MLGSEKNGLLKLLLKCCKHFDIFSTIPYVRNKNTKQFVLKSTKCLNHIKLKFYMCTLYSLLYLLQLIHVSPKLSLPLLVQGFHYLVFYSVSTYSLFHLIQNSKASVGLLNGLLLFEGKNSQASTYILIFTKYLKQNHNWFSKNLKCNLTDFSYWFVKVQG